jgi:thiol-disulfide isomerase/thioredoxin
MRRTFITLLLIAACAVCAAAQSGRKITAPAKTPPPPQPSADVTEDDEPEALPSTPSGELRILPESLLNRQLKSLENGSFRLADFRGKVVVLNLWATWCPPCRNEVPEYERVRKEYAGRNIEFVALTTEDPRTAGDRVKQFVKEFKFGFRLGWADRETALTIMNGKNVIPQTLVIAPDGRVIEHWRGFSRGDSGDHLRATLERALAEETTSQLQ